MNEEITLRKIGLISTQVRNMNDLLNNEFRIIDYDTRKGIEKRVIELLLKVDNLIDQLEI